MGPRRGVGERVRDALDRLEPPPRAVDWSLFAFVVAEAATGLISFTVGVPEGWPLFWLHRALGAGIVALLAWKLARVRRRLTDPALWRRSTALSVLTLVAALGALGTGVAWVFGLDVRLSYWTLLSVHVGFGLALVPLVAAHAATRFRLPRRVDFERRRTAVRYFALLAAGGATYRLQQGVNDALDTAGADRRFTGSQPREGAGNAAFPITSWVADDPDPIDRDDYRLRVDGLVSDPVELTAADLAAGHEMEALLDCTSGWYTVQEWGGIRVGDLLDAAGELDADAAYVRFTSVTGYRWSLPIDEAEEALLATRVGGEQLSHGHGAPARLVAPDRRGFQWVKWVTRVEVRSEYDLGQWAVTLVSGFE
ncbi:DMSO/TMAO reductase YedYZ molybdopterin-dependent catalytic subunit [Halorubrum trapanicum]|uniref:DMSO/TMAO reductase YedYZ molybdopterin-dependent catalytic subunit n=1 Tax=Halorubrum trapanicum TaxID=29284 RepID=A0A8J7R849_9EURY|nr:molybdopterin-dependent oxidoreductase [Halorubrum trapanicum]MBP1901368.1 DMSO/TMAO reductase YedYZ molybdopterin-dependent catalytic subunit [Halorubrum trapanicum]